jgi:thiol:disulfide interchange protein DsbG
VPASIPAPASALKATETTAFGLAGNAKAPRLWVFIDPLCGFSVRAMDQLRPYVAAGRVQIAVIPLSVLDQKNQGRSTVAAKAMLSLPPDQMITSWEASKLTGPADQAADTRLASNMAVAEAIGLRGTPTFVWRRADGSEGRSDGLPDNLETIIASMGG